MRRLGGQAVGQRRRRRFRSALGAGLLAATPAVVSVPLGSTVSAAAPALAGSEPIGDCTATTGVIVAVDFASFGGPVERACVADPPTGEAALGEAGFAPVPVGSLSGFFVCQLTDPATGTAEPPTSCADTPPASAYWTYWHALPGASTWTYSQLGAASYQPLPGSVEFWAFGSTVGGTAELASCLPSVDAVRNPSTSSVAAPRCPSAPAPSPTSPPTTTAPAPTQPAPTPPATAPPATTAPPTAPAPTPRATPAPEPAPGTAAPASPAPAGTAPSTPASALAPTPTGAAEPGGSVAASSAKAAPPATRTTATTTPPRPSTAQPTPAAAGSVATTAAGVRRAPATRPASGAPRAESTPTTSPAGDRRHPEIPTSAAGSPGARRSGGNRIRIADVPTSTRHRGDSGSAVAFFAGIGVVAILGGGAGFFAWRRRRAAGG